MGVIRHSPYPTSNRNEGKPKHKRSKHQAPTSRKIPSSKLQLKVAGGSSVSQWGRPNLGFVAFGVWLFGISLDLGTWCLELFLDRVLRYNHPPHVQTFD
jgi:hypothetical protein